MVLAPCLTKMDSSVEKMRFRSRAAVGLWSMVPYEYR